MPESIDDPDHREDAEALLDEVARLPRAERLAVVLLDLEGLTQDEAASRLGCSDRTLRRRLARAHDRLRDRLTRRGISPSASILGAVAASPSDPLPSALVDATARAALGFAAGTVPAPIASTVITLAEGVLGAMTWTKIKGIAAVLGCVVALGGTIGAASGFMPRSADEPAKQVPNSKPEAGAAEPQGPSPAEQLRALIKKYDDAVKATQAAVEKATTDAERTKIYETLGPFPDDYIPPVVALAEKYPADPAAADALFWVADRSLSFAGGPDRTAGRSAARALEIIARDHPDDGRLVTFCPQLTMFPTASKGAFLRALAERSTNRVVKGQATATLAAYLQKEASMASMFQDPNAPARLEDFVPEGAPDEVRKQLPADLLALRRQSEEFYAKYQPETLRALKSADAAALRRESDRLIDRVLADFPDIPHSRADGRPTRETLADVARRLRNPAPIAGPDPAPTPAQARPVGDAQAFQALAQSHKAAERKAQAAQQAAGQGMGGVKAYIAAAPKWVDYGPKMLALAEASPKSPEGFDALLWIVRYHFPFFDANEERAATLGKAVDMLIRDHLEYIDGHLDDRTVADGFNHWNPIPEPHVDRIFRTLYERGKSRETRGRMALMLAKHRKSEADFAESLDVRGDDPAKRPEIAIFAPSYLDHLRREGHAKLAEEAAAILDKVKADYGDIPEVNPFGPAGQTLGQVADRELAEIRALAVGKVAPEITGKDVDGKPITLSEFRGKVVVLDFGTHEHCGGCKVVYPRQRELVDAFRGRPFAMLGVNSGDKLATLEELAAKKEITWRCWFDGDDPLHPGPIFAAWNIRTFPTFVVLDHRGTIRHKDMHPDDPQFAPMIEALVKQAEAEAAPR